MTIYKTVIIEDNPDNAAVLRKIITENHPELVIVAEANSVVSAKEVLLKHKPDIALMDIELTPGTSFDVLAELNHKQGIGFEIIFITAHQRYDYATKAIDFSSLAFLTKPIDPKLLRGAIEKAKEKQTKKIQIDQLFTKLQALDERNTQIIVPTTNNNKTAVLIADITYFEADGQTTIVHLKDKSTLIAFRILGHFKKMLLEDYSFFLIHNSYFINIEHVKSFKYKSSKNTENQSDKSAKLKELEITLKNDEKLIASRRQGIEFIKYWNNLRGGGGFWDNFKNLFR